MLYLEGINKSATNEESYIPDVLLIKPIITSPRKGSNHGSIVSTSMIKLIISLQWMNNEHSAMSDVMGGRRNEVFVENVGRQVDGCPL